MMTFKKTPPGAAIEVVMQTFNPLAPALAALVLALMTTGCGPMEPQPWTEVRSTFGPLQVGEQLVYYDASRAELIRVEPTREALAGELTTERVKTLSQVYVLDTPGDDESVYVLGGGATPQLRLHNLVEGGTRTIALNSPYDRAHSDPYGEFMVLRHSGNQSGDEARNLNEVAVVDLREGADESAEVLTLFSRANAVVFAPPFELEGQEYRIALGLSTSEITLMDLDAEQSADKLRAIPLTVSQADTPRTPVQVEVVVEEDPQMPGAVSIFVLTDVGSDITQIMVQPAARADSNRRLDIAINQLYAGARPVSFEVLDLEGVGRRLFAIDGAQPRFTMVDVLSGESDTFALPLGRAATDLVRFETPAESGAGSEARLMAYSASDALVAMIRPELITLSSETPTVGKSVEAIRLQAAPQHVWVDEAERLQRVLVAHNAGFSLIDLSVSRASYISGAGTLSGVVVHEGEAFGVYENAAGVVRLEIESGRTSSASLDLAARSVALMPSRDLLVIDHGGAGGTLTVIPTDDLQTSQARSFFEVTRQRVLSR
ncbi:hypothetical protein EA187_12130 [Lujinxingia sediminis]|uniref:DUF4397 domain-containing protein n=1 Tax=Lujinxingia sediminis TaxID=2480984 RepID=A0ABY0CRW6_9DELT|nr:hypothetical protein [Lujinxingia sediminis]RVU43568.1 hypothetical protein EA187_12130 [Lujinxingia sediminis]